jgi:GxxExxY protein
MARRWREPWGEDYPHREITEAVIAAALRVQSALGPGLEEEAYRICLAHALHLDGRQVLRDVSQDLVFEGMLLAGVYTLDLVVDEKVVTLVRTVERLDEVDFEQLNSRLRLSGYEVGLLLNFRAWPLKQGGIRRMVHSRPKTAEPG